MENIYDIVVQTSDGKDYKLENIKGRHAHREYCK